MSQENIEIIHQLYERVIGAGKLEDEAAAQLVPEYFDPEIHLRQMSAFVDTTGDFHGYTGLREGRVVRWEVFDDPADAFRAAGLSE
jgi:hypothetical protein